MRYLQVMCVCALTLAAEKQYKSPEEHQLYAAVTKDFRGE